MMIQNQIKRISQLFRETKTRILIWYIFLMVGFVLLAVPLFYHTLLAEVKERVTNDLWEELEAFETFVDQEDRSDQLIAQESLRDLFKDFLSYQIPEDDNFIITVVGGHFYDSSPQALPPLIAENSAPMQYWEKLQQEVQGEQATNDPSIGKIIYVTKPIIHKGKVLGVLVVVHTTAGEVQEAIEAIFVTVKDLFIVLGLALICAWMISGKILSPLRSLTTTVRKISESDLSQRIPVEGTGELAELATTFNNMMDRLEKSFKTQKDLINDIGHELRTPITIIQGHLELMGDDPQEQQETLALVFDELERMTRMVNDLILLAKTGRPDFLQLEPVDLFLFTQELFSKITALAPRNWYLASIAQETITADGHRLTQAIMNLAENAVQHTNQDDRIELGTCLGKHEVRFWLKDTGTGIAQKEQKQIFERFFQGEKRKSTHEGSGLGLSIVSAIAEAHGGWVEMSSELGFGSTFFLVLPVDKLQTKY